MTTKQVLFVGLNPIYYKTEGKLSHFPLIKTNPRASSDPQVKASLAAFSTYTHVIISSKTCAKILNDYVSHQEWSQKRTIAIGTLTASCLQSLGINPVLVIEEKTNEDLINTLKNEDLRDAFVYWPHADVTETLIANFLYFQNIPYADCILYDTEVLHPIDLPNLNSFNEIVFTTPTTIDAFVKNYGCLPDDKVLTSISHATEKHLETVRETCLSFA